jgi:hypothetical protein
MSDQEAWTGIGTIMRKHTTTPDSHFMSLKPLDCRAGS